MRHCWPDATDANISLMFWGSRNKESKAMSSSLEVLRFRTLPRQISGSLDVATYDGRSNDGDNGRFCRGSACAVEPIGKDVIGISRVGEVQ